MSETESVAQRWFNHFLCRGDEFSRFWKDYLQKKQRDLLFVLGMGFDPRMCMGYEAVVNAKGSGKRDRIIIRFEEGPNSPSTKYSSLVEENLRKLQEIAPNESREIIREVAMWSKDGRRIGSKNAANVFSDLSDFSDYTDLVIDISALPRGIYFPLIGKALYLIDNYQNGEKHQKPPNLHVVISENAALDVMIKDEGIDEDANFIHGFTGTLETVSEGRLPRIWIPILGEHQSQQLEHMLNRASANEICPILPMPSADPRRGDNLLIEYRELLFDRMLVEPRNFVHVSEQNPFEVYQAIHRMVHHYKDALEDLGGCQVVISATSSKLLSIGALLAAYELKDEGVGVVNVETQGYHVEGDITEKLHQTVLSTIWLAGDCYAQ